jgi:hypothetical protein
MHGLVERRNKMFVPMNFFINSLGLLRHVDSLLLLLMATKKTILRAHR